MISRCLWQTAARAHLRILTSFARLMWDLHAYLNIKIDPIEQQERGHGGFNHLTCLGRRCQFLGVPYARAPPPLTAPSMTFGQDPRQNTARLHKEHNHPNRTTNANLAFQGTT